MVLLTEYLRKKHSHVYGENVASKEIVKNYINDRRKELLVVLKKLGLEEWLPNFKNEKGAYSFYEDEEEFLDWIYQHYGNILVPVRKNCYKNISDDDTIFIYQNLQQLFKNRGFENEEFAKRMEGPYNLLDYPIRKKNIEIKRINAGIERLINYITEKRMRTITSKNDDLAWISFVSDDLQKRVNYYFKVYDCMYESRQSEVSEYGNKKWNEMDDKQRENFVVDELLEIEVHYRCEVLNEVKELCEEKRKITNKSKELNLRDIYKLNAINDSIEKHRNEVRKQVAEEHMADKDINNCFNKDINYDDIGLKSSETLLNESIEEIDAEMLGGL